MTDSEGPEQEALFYIEGPDERGLRLDSPSQLRRPMGSEPRAVPQGRRSSVAVARIDRIRRGRNRSVRLQPAKPRQPLPRFPLSTDLKR